MKSIEIKRLQDQINDKTQSNEIAENVETISNDLKLLQNHKNKGHKRTSPGTNPEPKTAQEEHPCKVCKIVFDSNSTLEDHIKTHKIRCDICDFRTDTNNQLATHMKLNHKPPVPIKCSFCPDTFIEKKNIFAHRKQKHPTYAPCRNLPNCSFKDQCCFNHNPVTEGEFICLQCGTEFTTINNLMMHKKTHKKVICLKFLKGECDRNPCWYTHEITPSLPKAGTNQILEGFQGVQPGQIPPKQPNTPRNDQMIIQMMNMMKLQQAQINQMTQALQILATNKSTQQI